MSAVRWLAEKSEFPSDGHLKMKWSKQGKLGYSRWKSVDFETITTGSCGSQIWGRAEGVMKFLYLQNDDLTMENGGWAARCRRRKYFQKVWKYIEKGNNNRSARPAAGGECMLFTFKGKT